jgi:hypothetical protein
MGGFGQRRFRFILPRGADAPRGKMKAPPGSQRWNRLARSLTCAPPPYWPPAQIVDQAGRAARVVGAERQGNRVNESCGEEACEEVVVPGGGLAPKAE